MRKIFLILALMLSAQCSFAQGGNVYPPVTDPTGFQMFNGPFSSFTGLAGSGVNIFLNVPQGMNTLMISGLGAGTSNMQVNCSADPQASDTQVLNGPKINWTAIKSSTQLFSLNPTLLWDSALTMNVSVGIPGCQRVVVELFNAVTSAVLLNLRGSFTSASAPYGIGIAPTVTVTATSGASLNASVPTPLRASSNGVLANGVEFAAADAQGNIWALSTDGIGGLAGFEVLPVLFNGSTWDRQFYCPNTALVNAVASTVTQIVAASGSTKIRVCSFSLNPSTVTAGSTDIVYGTGSNCATGTTSLTGPYTLPASAVVSIPGSMAPNGALITPASQALCVRAVTSTVNGFITWEQH